MHTRTGVEARIAGSARPGDDRRVKAALLVGIIVAGCVGGAKPSADSSSPNADSVTGATVAASPVPSGTAVTSNPVPPPVAGSKSTAPLPPASSGARPVSSTRPHLASLTPTTGSNAGGSIIQIEIKGDRLTPTGNTVHFGPVAVEGLSASDGVIRFSVPNSVPSRGEVPPAAIQEGTYSVFVVNANGTSDTLKFTIRDR